MVIRPRNMPSGLWTLTPPPQPVYTLPNSSHLMPSGYPEAPASCRRSTKSRGLTSETPSPLVATSKAVTELFSPPAPAVFFSFTCGLFCHFPDHTSVTYAVCSSGEKARRFGWSKRSLSLRQQPISLDFDGCTDHTAFAALKEVLKPCASIP